MNHLVLFLFALALFLGAVVSFWFAFKKDPAVELERKKMMKSGKKTDTPSVVCPRGVVIVQTHDAFAAFLKFLGAVLGVVSVPAFYAVFA